MGWGVVNMRSEAHRSSLCCAARVRFDRRNTGWRASGTSRAPVLVSLRLFPSRTAKPDSNSRKIRGSAALLLLCHPPALRVKDSNPLIVHLSIHRQSCPKPPRPPPHQQRAPALPFRTRMYCAETKLVTNAVGVNCDAKRPCSTCTRSHSYAVAHAPPGADLPPHPECTFDDSSEPGTSETPDSPKNRFEQLESRINELEALLQEKDGSRSRSASANGFSGSTGLVMGYSDDMNLAHGSFGLGTTPDMSHFSSGPTLDDLAGVATLVGDHSNGYRNSNSTPFIDFTHTHSDSPQSDFGMELMSPEWPKNLPPYPFLRHLAEAFFTFTPGASRMFHAPTFMASLALHATHPKFPLPAILHAICAMGSMYTAAVEPTPSPPLPSYCENGGPSIKSPLTNSFAELQIKAAVDAIEHALRTTSDLFGSFQAQVIVSLWYWYNARWSEACVAFAVSLRYAVPCGLNACPPFDSISSSNMTSSSIIPAAPNVMEDETRRNTFWIAYMMERHFGALNNFAMMLDDEDISQMLPVHGDQFEQGILVPPNRRQWSHDPDVIETHLEQQTDSFILHVKATLLLSKVKIFNGRYKVRRHLGDPAMQPDPAGIPGMPGNDLIQTTPAFVEIDRLLVAFTQSLPAQLRDPLSSGVIDVNLFTALSTIHFGTIILHEGHANIGRAACISSCKVLAAARGILNLLYDAYSTSHNLALLGVFPTVCWFAAGRVLVRFLRAAIDANSDEHIETIRSEVNFFRSVINGVGESVPHAHHYGRLLNDYLAQTCGKQYATPLAAPTLPRRNPNTHEASDLSHAFDFGLSATATVMADGRFLS